MFGNQSQATPGNNEGTQNPQSSTSSSSFDTMLSEIRNEQGEPKYRSVEEGLNALKHSQEYIRKQKQERDQLEQELATLRQKADEIETLKETVSKLTQRQQEPAQQNTPVDEEAIANLVDRRLSMKQQEAVASSNQKAVAEKLREVLGEKAPEAFYEKASQMGFSNAEFEAMAAKSPKAVLTLFNIGGDVANKQTPKSPTPSGINTEHYQGNPTSFIGAEHDSIPMGGGEQHVNQIYENSRKMVEELYANGMTMDDLTIPANFNKFFKKQGN